MNKEKKDDKLIQRSQSKQKKSQNHSMEVIKKYLLKKTQNRYKLHLSDQQAFKWKFHQNKNNKPLSSFKLLNQQAKDEFFSWQNVQIQDLKKYSFPVLKYKTKQLAQFSLIILRQNLYFQDQIKDQEILRKLVTQISLNYNIVSYHNFSHAFSLSLLLFQCFQYHPELNKFFSEQDKFYAILAGFAHDLNHPGNNNAYQVKMKSKIAIDANNQSVLQKFHVKQLWNILDKNPNINILNKVPNSSKIKERITYLILMTDVAQHFKNLEQLKLKKAESDAQNKNILDFPQNREFFLGQLFHACDISNPCIDFQNYITWAALLSYQFNEQTRLQQQNQIQVSQMLKYKDLKTFYKGQLGFINFLVMPIWKEIGSICDNLKLFTDNVQQNIKTLNFMIQNAKQQDQIINQKNLCF